MGILGDVMKLRDKRQTRYAYDERLKPPTGIGKLDFQNKLIKDMADRFLGMAVLRAERFITPEDVSMTKVKVTMRDSSQISCYVLEPSNCQEDEVLPAIFYCHGGGFLFPVQPLMLQNSVYYVKKLRCRVFMPDYRLSWQYPFPVPFYDCLDTLRYVVDNAYQLGIDRNDMLIYGESAGGCLAAGITSFLHDNVQGFSFKGMMLIYPVTDNTMDYKSMEEYSEGAWSTKNTHQMWEMYLKNGDGGMLKYAAPANNDYFTHFPPSYVEPQEMDCLRDEGIYYASLLKRAGVDVELNVIKGSYHGFDDDYRNPFVINVLRHRCIVMKKMLGGRL